VNVLVVVPSHSDLSAAVRSWETILSDSDHLYLLSCSKRHPRQISQYNVHELQVNLREYRYSRATILSALLKIRERSPYMTTRIMWALRPFWNRDLWPNFLWSPGSFDTESILTQLMDDFVWNVRSFDPDLVDLRWMPSSHALKAKLSSRLPRIVVLSKGETHFSENAVTSWRQYDPRLKVSVVLPVFNGGRHLRRSIESCLEQSHTSIELVIVDDCSTDETPTIIREYAKQDERIVSTRNDRNLRLPRALNVGFARTTGQLLTWTSHDNWYAPDAIEKLVRYLCTWQDIDFVYSAFYFVDEEGRVNPKIVYPDPPWMLQFADVVGCCFLYRRAVYEQIGDYSVDTEYAEDHDYWLRVYRRFKMMRLPTPLYYYRTTGAMSKYAHAHLETSVNVFIKHFQSE
jgi:hypothetical protein